MIRRLAGVILVVTLLPGCSAHLRADQKAPPAAEPLRPSPSVTSPPFKSRPLTDLKKKVKGKIVIFHAEEKGEQANWTAEVRIGNAYKVAVDCVGPTGTLNVRTTKGLKFARQCIAGYTTLTVDNYPQKAPKTHQLTVQAPPGAKWAILIARLP